MGEKILVTRSFLPPKEEFDRYVSQIWDRNHLTNQGPLLKELEKKIKEYLEIPNFHFVTNGTLALQLAIHSLDLQEGEIITTPFSYVATTSSILWEHYQPIFVDIDPETLCIDPEKIEAVITEKTRAILAVHVFGNPCDVDAISQIAARHKLKVIYDAAHAFGVRYKNRSLVDYGDVSTCSFHATKLFHTIEGGGVATRDVATNESLELAKRFGHNNDDHLRLGINAKASEFQAAMGLCNLGHLHEIIQARRVASETYDLLLGDRFKKPLLRPGTEYNYAYYPIIFDSEEDLLTATTRLNAADIFPRRYFYPSLNTLPYLKRVQSCPISESVSLRVLSLPLYVGLDKLAIERICRIILNN